MAKIKRDLKKKPILDKTASGAHVIRACDGNTGLGDVTEALAGFTAANEALHAALRAVNLARSEAERVTIIQNDAEAEWNRKFEELCAAIESGTKGDSGKILSAGLSIYVRGHKPKLGTLAAPEKFSSKTGVFEGEVRLRWKNVPGRVAYVIEVADVPEGERVWRPAGSTTKCSASIKKLEPGRKYWFRVAALGTAGLGPWSDLELCRAA